MKKIRCSAAMFFLVATLGCLQAQEELPLQKLDVVQDSHSTKVPGKRLWQLSVVTLSVANVLDVQSSLGKHELNSTLAGSSGTFGARGVMIKSGFQGGLLGVEYLMLHRFSHGFVANPSLSKLYRTLAVINFASSALLSGIAAHNYTIPRQRP